MAKVMISIPDDLLRQVDLEAQRQGTSRSALVQKAVKREIGIVITDPDQIISRLEALASKGKWDGHTGAAAMIRQDRDRDG